MLDKVTVEHFLPLKGLTCVLQPEDGSTLPVMIEAIEEKPLARMSSEIRMPFTVTLISLGPSDFVDGQCVLELPQLGHVAGIFVSRVPPLGRDANLAYYHISFN